MKISMTAFFFLCSMSAFATDKLALSVPATFGSNENSPKIACKEAVTVAKAKLQVSCTSLGGTLLASKVDVIFGKDQVKFTCRASASGICETDL